MSAQGSTIVVWGYGLAGALYLLFALRVALARQRNARALALLVATAATAVWGVGTAASIALASVWLALVGVVADVVCYAGWYAFLFALLRNPEQANGAPARGNWLVPFAVAVIGWGIGAQLLGLFGFTALGDPGRLSAFDIVASAVLGLVLVELVFRNVAEESRWSVTPLCVGLAALFAFDLYTFAEALLFNRLDADVWSVRGMVRALAVPFVVISIVRMRGGKTRLVLSRQVVFRSTALAACGLYLLVMAAAGYYVRYFGGEWGRALQVAFLFAALLLLLTLTFSGSIRAKLRVTVSKHFFSYRYDYREEWLRFTQALSVQDQQAAVGQQVVKGLADMVESPGGGLWLREPSSDDFTPVARWNMPLPASDAHEHATSDLVTFLSERGWVVNLEEYRSAPERYGELRLPQWLSRLESAWLVVPLVIGTQMIGFVVLLTARTPIEVNWEVNDLLKTAARQAAIFIAHVRATEALLDARKFDAFNRMSAFVVHDLKNIVAQLSLMLRNAERHHDNPEFQSDMLMTVQHSVDRMKQLMLQLRDGTTPVNTLQRVELSDIASRVQRAKAGQQPAIEVSIDEAVAARGHEDRLERVIGHLAQNALDATSPDGRVWIRIGRQGAHALVEVGDTGHGMTADFVRDRLFKPFQTTKATGMGIGAYESHQYISELGGRLQVDSAPDAGTTIRLLVPASDTPPLKSVEPTVKDVVA